MIKLNNILNQSSSLNRLRLRKQVTRLAFCAATLLAAGSVLADDWPQWRGPRRDDISNESRLLKDWPAGGPPLAWAATNLGGGYSGVAVVGDRVYTMGEDATNCRLYALNAANGRVVWYTPIGKPGANEGNDYPGPRCTPTVADNVIVTLGQFGDLVCLDSTRGSVIWRHNLESEFGGKMMSGWNYAESPLVDGDWVVCTPGGPQGTMMAFSKMTGRVLWRTTDWKDKASYSSIVAANIGGVRQYVQLTDASVAGVATDGRLLWRAPRPGRVAVIPTPICADDSVYVSSGYNDGCNLFRITAAGGTFTAQSVYANKVMANHHGGVIKVGDYLYGHSDGKGWTCQDLKTGNAVWVEKDKLGKGSLTCAGGMLYLRTEGGKGRPSTIVLIEATPKGWTEHGRFDQPNRSDMNSWTHPVVANGRLYIRDQSVLLSYDVKQK